VSTQGHAPASSDAPPTVLVVEDEEAVRALVVRIFAEDGYRVLSAPDGASALAAAQGYEGRIDLVITDVVMPNMNGPRLVAELRARWPNLRVVYTTGYADDAIAEQEGNEAKLVLCKPFDPVELLDYAQRALGA